MVKRGASGEVQNKNISGSISLVMAILNNGSWFWSIIESTINTNIFTSFINCLKVWIDKNEGFGKSNILLLLDNCPLHRSKIALNSLNGSGIHVIFLPAYSPQLAPIELIFGIIKRRFLDNSKGSNIKLGDANSHNLLWRTLNTLSKRNIRSCFKWFLKEINQILKQPFIKH